VVQGDVNTMSTNAECRKFAPNIFNKSKCSACFRLKEDHSASAIELNKASRKISKCGYLFVAPDWDFSNPINRTKRWQRRWFVLYDDGELTYSVDDHPETIPQACIDMNKVMEVARADEVTGNPHSVAITAPERVHFVKGTCKEESNWWLEVLQIFPRSSVKTGRAKRNATFPGGIATTYIAQYSGMALQTPPVKCETETLDTSSSTLSTPDVSITEPTSSPEQSMLDQSSSLRKDSTKAESPTLEAGGRLKKVKPKPAEGTRAYRSLRSNTCENLSAIPQDYSRAKYRYSSGNSDVSRDSLVSPAPSLVSPAPSLTSTPIRSSRTLVSPRPDIPSPIPRTDISSPLPRADLTASPIPRRDTLPARNSPIPRSEVGSPRTKLERPDCINGLLLDASQPKLEIVESETKVVSFEDTPPPSPPHKLSPLSDLPVRGVPDGCGLELAPSSTPLPTTIEVPIPSPHELLNLKKGWLMKQGLTKEWQKHWFVLQGTAVMYFKDPVAENNGAMDGIIDLGLVQKVEERDVQRNYGFVVSTLDEREYILSAVTHGIRNNWINALKSASNLNSMPESDTPKVQPRDAFASEIKISRRNTSDSIALPSLAKSPEGRIRSETVAPSSPPLSRTPTSRLKKEKTRTGRASSLKSSLSMGTIPLTKSEADKCGMAREEEFSMIPERDVSNNNNKVSDGQGSVGLGSALSKKMDTSKTDFFLADPANPSDREPGPETKSIQASRQETDLVLARQTSEINNLRKKLDNMNADMDTTLKNLNNEQVRNSDLEKKIQDVGEENALLQIKTVNAEKSLREQSKEITSLNQKVREFSDLSSQYKAQLAENKTLRQKLEKIERINAGPNWKTLYESLQVQHQKERVLWEDKLKEMENELQNLLETNNEAEQKGHLITDLSHQLQESETRINQLLCQNDTLDRENQTNKNQYEKEMRRVKENVKELEEYIDKTDKSNEENNKDSEILRLRSELSEKIGLEEQLQKLENELTRSQGEVRSLTTKMIELSDSDREADKGRSRSLCSSRDNLDSKQMRMVRMDSLSELMSPLNDANQILNMEHDKLVLCYNDVVNRFNKAISEIKALKTSLKQAQGASDEAEIKNMQINQNMQSKEKHHEENMRMLSNKIEDLTSKYLASERQVRNLKLKLKSPEGKERRRSSTGVRPDELLVQREAESVLDDIELSLNSMEGYVKGKDSAKEARRKSYETSTKASRARRRSSDNSDVSFVERLKKTEKTITDMNRKLSSHGDSSSVYLECLRKQLMGMIVRYREEFCRKSPEVQELLFTLESVICASELPAIGSEEPGFPKAESISSHLDTVMSFLYRSVEDVYEMRRECTQPEITGTKVCSVYDAATGFCNGAQLANIIETQQTSLQAYLLLDLQQQLSNIQTRFFAFNREQTLKDYNDVTQTLLLKVLESKQFVPLSSNSCKKLKTLSTVSLGSEALAAMFRRLKREAHSLFSRIGTVTNDLVHILSDSVGSQLSDKELILEGIKSEVFNMIEEDERMREFQTSLVNIYLICSDCETGRDPERVNLMANREEALQSQAEVTRILIDQEITDLTSALNLQLRLLDQEEGSGSEKEDLSMDNLSQSIMKIASMVSQKCVTEAQITILNTILSLEDKEGDETSEDGDLDQIEDFVFNPENMNNECNEFMLVLNNYRQTQSKSVGSRPKLSLTGQSGATLENNLQSIRMENETKKARLSAAISEKRSTETPQEEKYQDLRVWCEKSMTAMEKSYENLLNELQVQHCKEKDGLKKEKESALAEETRATLSALDAMRKAHESEVQKEVEKFKKEFLSELRSKECIGALQSEYQEDRDEIKREILSVADNWQDDDIRPTKLSRSPSCPRLYSTLSLATPPRSSEGGENSDEPLKSPLTGMVANRKRVFETEY